MLFAEVNYEIKTHIREYSTISESTAEDSDHVTIVSRTKEVVGEEALATSWCTMAGSRATLVDTVHQHNSMVAEAMGATLAMIGGEVKQWNDFEKWPVKP